MTLYMEVTQDKYELPIAVAESPYELAHMRGIKIGSMLTMLSRVKCGWVSKGKYRIVEVDDEAD